MAAMSSRQNDEQILDWIRMRVDGMSASEAARATGHEPRHVSSATNKIRAADIAESGETDVALAYWGRE